MGVAVVLFFVLCFRVFVEFGGALILNCLWDFGVRFGRCLVFWIIFGISVWDLGGALCFEGFKG